MVAGSNPGTSPIFNISSATPAPAVRKTGADDFLNSENNKNDYDWYVLPFNCHIPFIFFTMFILPAIVFISTMMELLRFWLDKKL